MKSFFCALSLLLIANDATAGHYFSAGRKSNLGNVPIASRHIVNINTRSLATMSASISGGGTSGTPITSGAAASLPSSSISSVAAVGTNYTEVSRGGAGATRILAHDEYESAETEETTEVPEESISSNVTTSLPDVVMAMPTSTPEASTPEASTQEASTPDESQEEKSRRGLIPFRKKRSAKHIAKKLKNRNATNLKRKIVHAGFGLSFALLNQLLPKERFVPAMAMLSASSLLMELLRYRKGFHWMNEALHFVLGSSLRKHEMEGKFTGSFYFFTGVTATAALYPKACATLGICQLAIADPSASYFGRATRHVYWSRIENGLGGFGRNKGLLGFLGGALCCVPFNYRMLAIAKFGAENGAIPGGQTSIWIASFALGIAGAFADLAVPTPALVMPKKVLGVRVPPFHVDDNFVVPIVSGFACQKVFQQLGWSQVELARFLLI